VPEELIAQIPHDALTDVGHQKRREVRTETLGEIGNENGCRPEWEVAVARQCFVDDWLDQVCDGG
jgi:hypothetical protein